MLDLPVVAVSACLLGQKVRYDGNHKHSRLISEELTKYCQLIPICPEVEIGLGAPREKIQLVQVNSVVKAVKVEGNEDVGKALINFAHQFVEQNSLSGIVLQDRSPSCGVGNTKLFSESNELVGKGSGLFAGTVMELLPDLIVVQESQLQSKISINWFVEKLLR